MVSLLKYTSNMLFWIGFFMLFITSYSIYINSPYKNSFIELNSLLFVPMVINYLLILKDRIINYIKRRFYDEEIEDTPIKLPKIGHIESFVAFMWLIAPFLFAYIYYSYSNDWVDSLFESFSAITTTGLSVYNYNLPKDILLFRSFITWVGGIGFVGFSLTSLKGIIGKNLARAFGIGEEYEDIGIKLFIIYLIITVIGIIMCLYIGFSFFNSLNLTLAAIGNGGFIPYGVEWTSEQKIVINIIQLLGAISFPIYVTLFFKRNIKEIFRGDLKLFILVILILSSIFYLRGYSLEKTFSLVIPAISTGGFQEESLNVDDFSLYLIIIAMLIGGMQLSSAGGLKVSKIYVAIKGLIYLISKRFGNQNAIKSLSINKRPLEKEDLLFVYVFITSFVILYILSVLVLLYGGLTLKESLFTTASAISNTGYSIIDISSLSDWIKLFLIFIMYLGRIEIVQFFILIYSFYDRLRL